MEQILQFLLTYQDYVFVAMFTTLAVVALVNFVHNPYARQNWQLKHFNKKTLHSPSSIVWETRQLPMDYQRQWRAFVNSGCAKPSVVFEFVKRPQRYLLWFAHFVAFLLSVTFFVLALMLSNQEILATQVAFVLFSILVFLLHKLIGAINLSHARRVFGKFLHDLNTVVDIVKSNKSAIPTLGGGTNLPAQNLPSSNANPNANVVQTNQQPSPSGAPSAQQTVGKQGAISAEGDTSNPLSQGAQYANDVAPKPSTFATAPERQMLQNRGDVVEKAVQILQQNGLDSPRTIEEQRKLNIALNNLLQACCKK